MMMATSISCSGRPCCRASPFEGGLRQVRPRGLETRRRGAQRVSVAAGTDPAEKARQAERQIAKNEKEIKEQLGNMDNVKMDGNFAAKELEEGKERLKKHLAELDSLKGELKQAVKSETKK